MDITIKERFTGCLLGLAVGDALGAPVEFRKRGSFEPVSCMRAGGKFRLEAGTWTDDTAMALCLADSFIEKGLFDPSDQMARYLRWYMEGYRSCTGVAIGVGGTIQNAIIRFSCNPEGDPFIGLSGNLAQGNGSLMRLAPVPLMYFGDLESTIFFSGESSRTTHGSKVCIDACRYLSALIHEALSGKSKAELKDFEIDDVAPEIKDVVARSKTHCDENEIESSGYVLHTLMAALWGFWSTDSYQEGLLKVVNLGDDADTVGAVYGQLAGAYYGVGGIPEDWLDVLKKGDEVEAVALGLLGLVGRERVPM